MPHTQKRLLRVVLVLAAVSTLATVVIVIFGLPKIFSSADNSAAVKRGSDLQSCRSSYASAVTEATTAANDLVLRGLAAVGRADDDELASLVSDPPGELLSPIDEARARVERRTQAYASAVELSRRDPNEFLRRCRALDATPTGFRSCEAARDAGASPVRKGDPGFNPDLDRDGDGVACE